MKANKISQPSVLTIKVCRLDLPVHCLADSLQSLIQLLLHLGRRKAWPRTGAYKHGDRSQTDVQEKIARDLDGNIKEVTQILLRSNP